MLKFQVALIALLIGCVTFISCEEVFKVVAPVGQDPEVTDPGVPPDDIDSSDVDSSDVDSGDVDSGDIESLDNQPPTEIAPELNAGNFTIDATNREMWTYFSFTTGDVVEVNDPLHSMDWDLGFQRTKVKLNGGVSGPGMGGAIMLEDVEFDQVKEAPEAGYVADSDANFAIIARSEAGWYVYTGPPNHWVLPLEGRVFVIKAADGTFAKIRFIGYYKDNENKKDSGFVTFEYVHQPDGSRSF